MTTEPYDLVIIGGGITGAGIARDAVLRGMKVAMFEKGDFGSGTSSKSSKMIHGGLRYLEHGEIGLVFESVSERRVQQRVAPHLVRAQAFLVPIYKDLKPGLELMNLGLWIYDTLALFRAPRMHKTFRGAKAAELEPDIKHDGLKGIIEYYDCATDDARLVLENVLDAAGQGAVCRNYTEVVRLERDGGGRVHAVTVRDVFTRVEEKVACRAVVIAAGAWTDEMITRFEVPIGRPLLRRTKGVHLVFPRERIPVSRAITMISPVDSRVMFVIPWRGRTVVGTTDTDFEGTADEVWADPADAEYLCASVNEYFPKAHVTPKDIIATWAGLRPLIRGNASEDESEVSREHEVFVRDDGIIIIAGGKLTTYRRMAKEVVRTSIKWLKGHDDGFAPIFDRLRAAGTKERPLPGAMGLDDPNLAAVAKIGQQLMDEHGLDADTATHLCGVYGVRGVELGAAIRADRSLGERLDPELPYVWAEIDFAVEQDLARTIDDVLSRRVPLLLVGRDQGLEVCERVADRLANKLGWSADVRASQLAGYRDMVAESRKFPDLVTVDHGRFRERADALTASLTVEDAGSPYREASGDLLGQAEILVELGRCQWQLARLDAAERSLGRAHELRERLLPAGHPLIIDVLERLAALRHYQLRDAGAMFDDVVTARIAAHGLDHVATAIALRNHGAYLRDAGLRGAAARLEEAERVLREVVGEEHPEYAAALKARACLELHAPPPAWHALELAERAYHVAMLVHPDDHPFVGAAILLVARGQAKVGEARAGRRSFADARANLEAAYGEDHPLLAFVTAGVAGLDRGADELRPAIDGWRRAIAIYEQTYAASPFGARIRWKVAEALLRLGEPEEALVAIDAGVAALTPPLAEWDWRAGWLLGLAELAEQLGYVQVSHRAAVHAAAFEE